MNLAQDRLHKWPDAKSRAEAAGACVATSAPPLGVEMEWVVPKTMCQTV